MTLSIRPMQWANLPELHQTATLDDSDLHCLEEIRDVLARHGKLARFAVPLAHRHFKLAPGEILIERPDPDGRTQHVTVGRLDDEPEARPTTWLFEEGPEMRLSDAVYCDCVSDPNRRKPASGMARVEPRPSRTRGTKRRRKGKSQRKRPATNRAARLQATTNPAGKGNAFTKREFFCIRSHVRFQAIKGGAFQPGSF